MAATELSKQRIHRLYEIFRGGDPWTEWVATFTHTLSEVEQTTDEAMTTPELQARLWALRPIASIGQGEHIDVKGALTDPEVVEAIVGLRRRRWPEEPSSRAKTLQAAFDQLLERVRERHAGMRPQAKLGRIFMALLPAEMHACFSWRSNKDILELILGPGRKLGYLESAVLVRHRLRAVLGPEGSLEEHAHRATFCWWLHEHVAELALDDDEKLGDIDGQSRPCTGAAENEADVAPLVLWPFSKQFKGLTAVRQYVDAYRAVVSAAEQGAAPEDIVETMRADFGFADYSPQSCRRVFNRVRYHGLLEHRDGLWCPSERGQRLLNEDPPDVLVEELLVKSFGLAHILRNVGDRGPLARGDINRALRDIYPSWNTDFTPNSTTAWAVSLGLLDTTEDGLLRLTTYGRSWEHRLPRHLPVPAPEESIEPDPIPVRDPGPADKDTKATWPTLAEILVAFRDDADARRLLFTDDQVRSLHLAWHSQPNKRFALLSGLSGTGKTQILLLYARLYCQLLNLKDGDAERHRAVVAVSPDWRDPTGLLGYFNALHADPTFQIEPALRLVLEASRSPHLPFFLILDEMNLARVERYFAPFLSAMESGEPLVLHAHDDAINGVPPRVSWPANLFIGGTVNMDETTHPFSDKVLDRAFSLEFWDVDLGGWFPRRAAGRGTARQEDVEALLVAINAILAPIRRHMGYRSAGEVLAYVEAAGAVDGDTRSAVIDQAIFSKLLPRLRGTESPALHTAFDDLRAKLADLPRCRTKLETMQAQLTATGVTRFWA